MHVCLRCDGRFVAGAWTCPRCGFEPDDIAGYRRFAPEFGGDEGMLEESFATLEAVEDGSFWFRARNELLAWALATHFGGATSFLEVGCGNGYVTAGIERRFPHLRIVAGEPFDAGVRVARRRLAHAEAVQMDARRLPFDGEFDVVAAFDVLEHIPQDVEVLAQMRQAVAPGGGVLITVPQHPWLWSPLDDYAQHQRRYTRRGLVARLRATGFEPVLVTSFVSLLLPMLLLSRARQRNRPVDPGSEFGLPRSLDRALERVMTVERAMIARGVSLPAGGSLLAVAYAAEPHDGAERTQIPNARPSTASRSTIR